MKDKNYISDTELEKLLNTRMFEAANDNLAYKIITRAKNRRYAQDESYSSFFDLIKEFLLPKQAFAMAVALLIGLYLGQQFFQTNITTTLNEEYQVSSFLDYNGGL